MVLFSNRKGRIVCHSSDIIKQQKTLMDSKQECINSHFGILSLVLSAYISNTSIQTG